MTAGEVGVTGALSPAFFTHIDAFSAKDKRWVFTANAKKLQTLKICSFLALDVKERAEGVPGVSLAAAEGITPHGANAGAAPNGPSDPSSRPQDPSLIPGGGSTGVARPQCFRAKRDPPTLACTSTTICQRPSCPAPRVLATLLIPRGERSAAATHCEYLLVASERRACSPMAISSPSLASGANRPHLRRDDCDALIRNRFESPHPGDLPPSHQDVIAAA